MRVGPRDPVGFEIFTEYAASGNSARQSGPLADEVGELLARRFPSHEQEHRHEQEEREGEEWKRSRYRVGRRDPADDRRRERSGCAAEGERRADRRPADWVGNSSVLYPRPAPKLPVIRKFKTNPTQNRLDGSSRDPKTVRRIEAGRTKPGMT